MKVEWSARFFFVNDPLISIIEVLITPEANGFIASNDLLDRHSATQQKLPVHKGNDVGEIANGYMSL
jgi:hypothetical protein